MGNISQKLKMSSEPQKQEKILEENPEEKREAETESEVKALVKETISKKASQTGKNSKTGEIKVGTGVQSVSPPKRAPRLADMGKTPSMEKNGRWGGFSQKKITLKISNRYIR